MLILNHKKIMASGNPGHMALMFIHNLNVKGTLRGPKIKKSYKFESALETHIWDILHIDVAENNWRGALTIFANKNRKSGF